MALPTDQVRLAQIQALLLTQVLPLALNLSGLYVLHSSAIRVNGGAVAFLGRQNQGKSTLAAAFVQAGYPLVSDDALPVLMRRKQVFVVPSLPEIRVSEEVAQKIWKGEKSAGMEATGIYKKRFTVEDSFCTDSLPLHAIYILDCLNNVDACKSLCMIQTVPPAAGLMSMIEHSFRLDILDQERLGSELEFLAGVAQRITIRKLRLKRSLEAPLRAVEMVVGELT